jgi:hypothetical protein
MPHEARSLLELVLRYPARRFDAGRRVFATECGKTLEDRPASDIALHHRDLVFAVDG